MSLIQEALKRQQMEQEGKVPETPDEANNEALERAGVNVDDDDFILPGVQMEPAPEPTATPGPALKRKSKTPASPPEKPAAGKSTPEKPTPEKPASEEQSTAPKPESERKRITPAQTGTDETEGDKPRVLPAIVAMVVLFILLGAALIWAVTYGLKMAGIAMPWDQNEAEIAEQPVDEQPAGEQAVDESSDTDVGRADGSDPDGKVAESTPSDPATAAESADGKPDQKPTVGSIVRKTVADENTAAGDADLVMADAAEGKSTAEEPASSGTASGSSAVDNTKPEPPVEVATKPVAPAPIRWPDFTISGIVGRGPKGAVFIDGKVYGINEIVDGVRILEIKQQGALLQYKGETRLAKVGQPLNRGGR